MKNTFPIGRNVFSSRNEYKSWHVTTQKKSKCSMTYANGCTVVTTKEPDSLESNWMCGQIIWLTQCQTNKNSNSVRIGPKDPFGSNPTPRTLFISLHTAVRRKRLCMLVSFGLHPN
ncbi:uncharacterized protein LACBIDRAFT_298630 [Laccaria bicolor S238N-H82]|uniref:Predicted protein n=1 Tax=Laccaria bicolor (strain S238N-H82 / ATCC MYA-4686) TaxID=486041 RepID=B0DD95_LACBS|nr:uncharacterized protein LACBIDRAFT_298630 [Laccaria bicolor S238N-H82]EDR07438.1 predicted protein [Laccaria bicolor S238N-H82]|eukprot:XP_001881830.1 predicted protein [Laccaria bicolor S238N-H82]